MLKVISIQGNYSYHQGLYAPIYACLPTRNRKKMAIYKCAVLQNSNCSQEYQEELHIFLWLSVLGFET